MKYYLEKKFPNVEVFVSQENNGYGHGNNIGISKVKTKCLRKYYSIIFVNSKTTLCNFIRGTHKTCY